MNGRGHKVHHHRRSPHRVYSPVIAIALGLCATVHPIPAGAEDIAVEIETEVCLLLVLQESQIGIVNKVIDIII